MHRLETLVARVGTGDPTAEADLRRHLEGCLALIVRRTLRTRTACTVLSRKALAEAERLGGPGRAGSGPERDRLIAHVVRRLGEQVLGNLRRERAAEAALRETVCT
jgi:hypothetical protein